MADTLPNPEGRRGLQDFGLACAVAFAAVLVFTVEWIASAFRGVPVHRLDWFVFALIAAPLLISIGALAVTLSRRPVWMRWTAALLILLVPQVFMFGVLNG